MKTLREIAQERSIEIAERQTEVEHEMRLDSLIFNAEAIVIGKIDKRVTTFDGDHFLRNDYTVQVERVVKEFESAVPLETYSFLLPSMANFPPSSMPETITVPR